ncbi:hypothetical protein SEA_NUTELLO_59 [Mycobacterium phage Nutello]|nr:hypothetical protein SEA_NUTELLO_59 [Mycobacterium phage Nutello]
MPDLIELSVAEVQRFAEVVRARIGHPSHTPVQAIRAGLAAVNAMRLAAAPAPVEAAPVAPRSSRRVGRLGVAERGSEWIDVDGDRWRWAWWLGAWQYKPVNPLPCEGEGEWIDCPSNARDKAPSSRYAPFTEVSPK